MLMFLSAQSQPFESVKIWISNFDFETLCRLDHTAVQPACHHKLGPK